MSVIIWSRAEYPLSPRHRDRGRLVFRFLEGTKTQTDIERDR